MASRPSILLVFVFAVSAAVGLGVEGVRFLVEVPVFAARKPSL